MTSAIVVTYAVSSDEPLSHAAEEVAYFESTGHWAGDGQETSLFREAVGWVEAVREEGPGRGEIDIALPLVNLPDRPGFTDLYMAIASGATPALLAFRESQIVDIRLPPAVMEAFPGPRFGRAGVEARLRESVPDGLMVGTIVKPVSGLTPAQVAADCAAAASAGVGFIKDDQKMLNPAYCPLVDRVKAVHAAFDRVEQETGRRRPLYAPHITTRPDRLLEAASQAVEAGAEALMVNFLAAGFPALEILAESGPNVPLYAHCGGKETMTRVERQGMHAALVLTLARLVGADLIRISAPGGDLIHSDPPTVRACLDAAARPLDACRPLLPAVSGGLNLGNLAATLDVCGDDVLVLAGRGVANHPGGVGAGVTALRDAARAWAQGISGGEIK